jgi:heme exporter protein CcmD
MITGDQWRMGGYGGYVWSSYGLSLAALILLVVIVHRRWRSAVALARRLAQAEQSSKSTQD